MANGTPITYPEDESFDIGSDTRTGVADKLTFKLEPMQNAAAEPKTELAPIAAPEPDPIDESKG